MNAQNIVKKDARVAETIVRSLIQTALLTATTSRPLVPTHVLASRIANLDVKTALHPFVFVMITKITTTISVVLPSMKMFSLSALAFAQKPVSIWNVLCNATEFMKRTLRHVPVKVDVQMDALVPFTTVQLQNRHRNLIQPGTQC